MTRLNKKGVLQAGEKEFRLLASTASARTRHPVVFASTDEVLRRFAAEAFWPGHAQFRGRARMDASAAWTPNKGVK